MAQGGRPGKVLQLSNSPVGFKVFILKTLNWNVLNSVVSNFGHINLKPFLRGMCSERRVASTQRNSVL